MFVEDDFTGRAHRFVRALDHPAVVSDWTIAETVSAIGRGVRTGALTRDSAYRAIAGLDGWVLSAAERIEVAPADVRSADGLLRSLNTTLRTPDALHVAVALRTRLPLLTFDVAMARDAQRLGLSVVDA